MVAKGTPYLGNGRDNNDYEFVKCKKCGHEYYKSWNYCPECRTERGKGNINSAVWIVLVVLILIVGFKVMDSQHYRTPNGQVSREKNALEVNTEQNIQVQENEVFSEAVVAYPPTGIYQLFSTDDLVAPLKIQNNTDKYYLGPTEKPANQPKRVF